MKKRIRPKRVLSRIFIYGSLCFVSLLFLVPLIVMLITAIKSPQEIVNTFALPQGIYIQNFRVAINSGIGRGMINSLCIVVPGVTLSTMLGAIAAYPLSQFKFRGDKIVYLVLLSGLFLPFQSVIIPLFLLMRTLNLYDTFWGLWLVHTVYGIPICTFYLRNYFATIPRSLMEAAVADGCSLPGYFFRILLRLGQPGLAAVIVLQSRSIWNDLLAGLSFTRSTSVSPVTVVLATLTGSMDIQYGPLMAATLISIIPTVTVFLIFKRSFISGVLAGSVKS
jgi:glucose/mannose transport system permease protein